MLRYLRMLLELDSYQVETASNGPEAVQLLRQGYSPAIVLLDVEMPGMDGLHTLREMGRVSPDLKVIMCSGLDDPETARRAALLGAKAYITKPVKHLYLSAAIEKCIGPEVHTGHLKSSVKANLVKMPGPGLRPPAAPKLEN